MFCWTPTVKAVYPVSVAVVVSGTGGLKRVFSRWLANTWITI